MLAPVSTSGGTDRYEITQREASAEILPGVRTPLWTYEGTFPGPTIESRRGRPVTVTHRNELPVPTVVHLHGGRTPAASDGYPTDLVLPEGWHEATHAAWPGMHGMHDPRAVVTKLTRDYTFPLDQRPTLLWYHDHRMDFTAPAIWRGLAGLHIVRDDAEDALGLPAGQRELPLMIADRAFAADGSLAYPALDPTLRERPGVREPYLAGVLGDVILVNGAPWPVHEVDAARYRLRILNASNARHYELEAVTDDGRRLDLVQIGADQGLLAAPVTHRLLPIAPAERYDVIIDFSGVPVGSRVRLVNRLGSGRTRDVMAFRVGLDTQQRAGAPSRAPGLLFCQEAGVSPCAPGRRPLREQAHAEAERCCSRNARAFSAGSASMSDCSRPGVDVGRAAASCDREVLDEVVAGRGGSIMGCRGGWPQSETWMGWWRATRSCTR